MPAVVRKEVKAVKSRDPLLKALGGDEKLRLLVLSTIVLALIAAAVVLLQGSSQSHGIKACLGIALSGYRDTCISNLAYSSENATLCSYLDTSQGTDQCLYSIAINTSNSSTCLGINNQESRSTCVYTVASKTGAYTACYKLNGTNASYEYQCLSNMASELHDPSICSGIGSTYSHSVCMSAAELRYVYATSNATACMSVSNSTNPETVNSIATYSGIYSYGTSSNAGSNTIINSNFETPLSYVQFLSNVTYSARDLCYLYVSYKLGKPEYCNYIVNQTLSGLCSDFIQSAPGNSTASLGTSGITTVSENSLGSSIIPNLTGLNYSQISAGLCENATVSVPGCATIITIFKAIGTKNVSVCRTLQSQAQYTCFAAMAQAYVNSSYCTYINNASLNSACLQNIYNNT